MIINKDTNVGKILETYGDIAPMMELMGVKRIGRFSVRRLAARFLTVERAAKVHRVPLDAFLLKLNKALELTSAEGARRP